MNRLSRRGLFAGAAAAAAARIPATAAAAPGAEPAPSAPLPPIDAAAIAKRVVRALAPSAGERAILVADPRYYPELAESIELEFLAAGVEALLALEFDPPDVVNALAPRSGGEKRQDDVVAWLAPIFAKANLFVWLPARALHDDTRLERLVDGSAVRGIHFHWILGLEGRSSEEISQLSRLYERAILETDYAALSREQERLIRLLRGKSLRLTSPGGTDLTMRVPPDAWFHKNDGDMSAARARTARCARDREMELPAGALRFIPDPSSVDGRARIRRVATPQGTVEGATFDFRGGRVRQVSAEKGEEVLRKHWDSIGGDVDKVGEIVLGTSPLLAVPVPSGELPYFGYGAGAVRVSLGDNWESGGPNRTAGHRNWWLFLPDASLEAGGTAIVRAGRLVG
jgi:hypothetical protein